MKPDQKFFKNGVFKRNIGVITEEKLNLSASFLFLKQSKHFASLYIEVKVLEILYCLFAHGNVQWLVLVRHNWAYVDLFCVYHKKVAFDSRRSSAFFVICCNYRTINIVRFNH